MEDLQSVIVSSSAQLAGISGSSKTQTGSLDAGITQTFN